MDSECFAGDPVGVIDGDAVFHVAVDACRIKLEYPAKLEHGVGVAEVG